MTARRWFAIGVFPLHCDDGFVLRKGQFGTAILFTTPLVGAYAVMRLVLRSLPRGAIANFAWFIVVDSGVMPVRWRSCSGKRGGCFVICLLESSSLKFWSGWSSSRPIGLTVRVGACGCPSAVVDRIRDHAGRCIEAKVTRVSFGDYHGMYRQMDDGRLFSVDGLAAIGFAGDRRFRRDGNC